MLYFTIIFQGKLKKKETVIFIDEVQVVPKIITLVKEIVIEGSYRYILCGSLQGLELHNVSSIPVGYTQIHTLYPLSFIEFLKANNVSNELISMVYSNFSELSSLHNDVYENFMKYFKTYMIVGGMPSVIKKYIELNDYEVVFLEQEYIINMYKEDFSKYENLEKKLQLKRIYDEIPSQLKKEYNRFTMKDIDNVNRFSQIENSVDWLINAGVSHKVKLTSELIDGIKQSERELFKLYLSDIGLLLSLYGRTTRNKIIIGDTNFNFGYLYENFVCMELISKKYVLYYYNSRKHGEVEFIVEDKNTMSVLPIEVKSGSKYLEHSALDYVLLTYLNIKNAYVFGNCNISKIGKIIYLPIFMASFLNNNE
ncbi:MAG: ATP-binding protein [Acholeplasmatales bacterium]|nr:ATP-binding protein [Acholeplasmatales bacterium]